VLRLQEVESSNPKDLPNLTQRCKRFATSSTSMQVAVLSWCYDAEMSSKLVTRFSVLRRV